MKKGSILLLALLTSVHVLAQQANQFHSWWIFEGRYQVKERLALQPIYAWSRNDFVKNWQQSLLGSGINYDFKSDVTFGVGYEWIERFPYGEQPLPHQITIHRFYQKVVFKHQVGRVGITYLLRSNQEYVNKDARYFMINQIGLKVPIRWKGKATKSSLKFSEGIFINHGKWAKKSFFGQSRTYAGFYFSIGKAWGLDLGYLNHYLIKQNDLIENNHTLLIKVTHGGDIRKGIVKNR